MASGSFMGGVSKGFAEGTANALAAQKLRAGDSRAAILMISEQRKAANEQVKALKTEIADAVKSGKGEAAAQLVSRLAATGQLKLLGVQSGVDGDQLKQELLSSIALTASPAEAAKAKAEGEVMAGAAKYAAVVPLIDKAKALVSERMNTGDENAILAGERQAESDVRAATGMPKLPEVRNTLSESQIRDLGITPMPGMVIQQNPDTKEVFVIAAGTEAKFTPALDRAGKLVFATQDQIARGDVNPVPPQSLVNINLGANKPTMDEGGNLVPSGGGGAASPVQPAAPKATTATASVDSMATTGGLPKIRETLFPGEKEYFSKHPEVAGMAAEDDFVILNPNNNLSDSQTSAVVKNEQARILMRTGKVRKPSFSVTKEQKNRFSGTPYESDENALKETIAARILSGDSSAGNITPEQRKYVDDVLAPYFKDYQGGAATDSDGGNVGMFPFLNPKDQFTQKARIDALGSTVDLIDKIVGEIDKNPSNFGIVGTGKRILQTGQEVLGDLGTAIEGATGVDITKGVKKTAQRLGLPADVVDGDFNETLPKQTLWQNTLAMELAKLRIQSGDDIRAIDKAYQGAKSDVDLTGLFSAEDVKNRLVEIRGQFEAERQRLGKSLSGKNPPAKEQPKGGRSGFSADEQRVIDKLDKIIGGESGKETKGGSGGDLLTEDSPEVTKEDYKKLHRIFPEIARTKGLRSEEINNALVAIIKNRTKFKDDPLTDAEIRELATNPSGRLGGLRD